MSDNTPRDTSDEGMELKAMRQSAHRWRVYIPPGNPVAEFWGADAEKLANEYVQWRNASRPQPIPAATEAKMTLKEAFTMVDAYPQFDSTLSKAIEPPAANAGASVAGVEGVPTREERDEIWGIFSRNYSGPPCGVSRLIDGISALEIAHAEAVWECEEWKKAHAEVVAELDAAKRERDATEQTLKEECENTIKLREIISRLQGERDAALKAEHDMSDAYVRLRQIIPGALDTPTPPGDVIAFTENKARNLVLQNKALLDGLNECIKQRDAALSEVTTLTRIMDLNHSGKSD